MAIYERKNDILSIAVDSCGAELKSLKKLADGTEYLWCGDTKYWGRTSPVLFPFVGGLQDRTYRAGGKTYHMGQHGFARDMEFELSSCAPEELWFTLRPNEETRQNYPYEFLLRAGYRLEGSRVRVLWQVENPGTETLFFSIGGHPAFNCPIEEGTAQTDYFLDFGPVNQISCTKISENGLALDAKDLYRLDEGRLALTEHLFDHDALVVENRQTDTVALCKKDGTRYVTVTMDAPLFGVWSPAGRQAPFVCIEPWYGRCDREGFLGTLEEREWGNQARPGETWEASYVIEI